MAGEGGREGGGEKGEGGQAREAGEGGRGGREGGRGGRERERWTKRGTQVDKSVPLYHVYPIRIVHISSGTHIWTL